VTHSHPHTHAHARAHTNTHTHIHTRTRTHAHTHARTYHSQTVENHGKTQTNIHAKQGNQGTTLMIVHRRHTSRNTESAEMCMPALMRCTRTLTHNKPSAHFVTHSHCIRTLTPHTHTHTHTNTLTQTHPHTHTLSLSLSRVCV
jgi:hypothetical protein